MLSNLHRKYNAQYHKFMNPIKGIHSANSKGRNKIIKTSKYLKKTRATFKDNKKRFTYLKKLTILCKENHFNTLAAF